RVRLGAARRRSAAALGAGSPTAPVGLPEIGPARRTGRQSVECLAAVSPASLAALDQSALGNSPTLPLAACAGRLLFHRPRLLLHRPVRELLEDGGLEIRTRLLDQ